jgi:hypothetical protein
MNDADLQYSTNVGLVRHDKVTAEDASDSEDSVDIVITTYYCSWPCFADAEWHEWL